MRITGNTKKQTKKKPHAQKKYIKSNQNTQIHSWQDKRTYIKTWKVQVINSYFPPLSEDLLYSSFLFLFFLRSVFINKLGIYKIIINKFQSLKYYLQIDPPCKRLSPGRSGCPTSLPIPCNTRAELPRCKRHNFPFKTWRQTDADEDADEDERTQWAVTLKTRPTASLWRPPGPGRQEGTAFFFSSPTNCFGGHIRENVLLVASLIDIACVSK